MSSSGLYTNENGKGKLKKKQRNNNPPVKTLGDLRKKGAEGENLKLFSDFSS
jgi:hypothetical protein